MSFNVFKNMFSKVSLLAKSMDTNIDSFSDNLILNLENFGISLNDPVSFLKDKDEETLKRFKQEVVYKSFEIFDQFSLKFKKPKNVLDDKTDKKRTTGFIIYNIEKRAELKKEFPSYTFEHIGKIVGDSWKELPDSEKINYNKQSATINGVEYKNKVIKEKIIFPCCSHQDCEKKVKGEMIDDKFLCTEHKKKYKSSIQKNKIKEDILVEVHPIPSIEIVAATSQTTKSKNVKKTKKEKQDEKNDILKRSSFKFETEHPVDINNTEFWITNGIKGESDRINMKTGLILKIEETVVYLSGLCIDDEVYEEEDLPIVILKWIERSGITTKRNNVN